MTAPEIAQELRGPAAGTGGAAAPAVVSPAVSVDPRQGDVQRRRSMPQDARPPGGRTDSTPKNQLPDRSGTETQGRGQADSAQPRQGRDPSFQPRPAPHLGPNAPADASTTILELESTPVKAGFLADPQRASGRRWRKFARLIRTYCLRCQGGQALFVRECPSNGKPTARGERTTRCPLWPLRMGVRAGTRRVNRLRRIRRKCLDCLATAAEVQGCAEKGCELWAYRTGRALQC